jgi:hypothetical protein
MACPLRLPRLSDEGGSLAKTTAAGASWRSEFGKKTLGGGSETSSAKTRCETMEQRHEQALQQASIPNTPELTWLWLASVASFRSEPTTLQAQTLG